MNLGVCPSHPAAVCLAASNPDRVGEDELKRKSALSLSRCHLKTTQQSRKCEPLRLLTHLLGCSLFYSLAHSFTYLITHSITCSFTHSLSYSLISLRVSVDVKQHFNNNSILGLLYFAFWVRAQEPCENRGGRPGIPSLIGLRFLWT